MKMPKIIKGKVKKENQLSETIKLEKISLPDYYPTDFRDSKEFVRFIKGVEAITRKSIEYKNYVRYLKQLDMTKCSFFSNINTSEIKGVRLEMHHYPLTLFDITSIITMHRINELGGIGIAEISPFLIAHDVMEAHYENTVGLIPLTKTVHELAHSGEIFIPLTMVFGNVRGFLKKYKLGLTPEHKDQLLHLIELTEKIGKEYDPEILIKKSIKLEVPEFAKMQPIKIEEKDLA